MLLATTIISSVLAVKAEEAFRIQPVTDSVFAVMKGKSFPDGRTVKRNDLRYITVMHYDAQGEVHKGELVCNKAIADDLLDIFQKLYEARYPIERMRLIDNYGADDELSMTANNTSCFCYRVVKGSRKLSKHAQGLAIDINPLYNPYVRGNVVQPKKGKQWASRKTKFLYKIEEGDLLWQLFTEHGFTWGGSWRSLKDWQHFEK